ncbi:4'-phosphopantetheinyl transferase family protein [Rossellomorea sp. BNER]|uniref:4'-phosphopantetheinyl transferase family protein n=1 Tax=Rossellomorea sp. BNER TaxID=2962031 RepID=UPI003AF1F871|nr:4'-phosphopantetheinyl transferase superfamily protein [Rossellomorea sp. BNER]
MGDIFCVHISEDLDPSIFNRLKECLSLEKRRKIERFYHFSDAQRGLFSELLIRYIIRKKGFLGKEIHFEVNRYGKPFFSKISDFEFNISHSGEWIVCAVDQSPVGIDVELVSTIDFDIAHQFFTAKECEYIFSSEEQKLSRFYEIWTLKESYIKAIGLGLSIPLNSFSIIKQESYFTVETEKSMDVPLYLTQIKLDHAYKLAVCSYNRYKSNQLTLVRSADLVEFTLKEIHPLYET